MRATGGVGLGRRGWEKRFDQIPLVLADGMPVPAVMTVEAKKL